MKIRVTTIIIIILLFSYNSFAFTEIENAQTTSEKYEKLKQKIDLLETELAKIKIEKTENNPYATGEVLNWGTGKFASLHVRESVQAIEFGYIGMSKVPSFNKNGYIGKNRGYRYGLSIGAQVFDYTELRQDDDDNFENYHSDGNAWFARITGGSPVLLNFISATANFKVMYIDPDSNIYDKTESEWGWGAGLDIEFWLVKSSCISLGWEQEYQATSSSEKIIPPTHRFNFGIKAFF